MYDLQNDPQELRNLAIDPAYAKTVQEMNARLFEILQETGGMTIPLYPDRGGSQRLRSGSGAPAAEFPDIYVR